MRERLIVVVAKSPEPGRVKTRLVGDGVTAEAAADLARAFLADTLTVVSHPSLASDVWLALDDDSDPAYLPPLTVEQTRVSQGGGELGERLARLSARAFEQGYRAVVLVGADCPYLPVGLVQEAFGRLTFGDDLALGPATDGGYYLIALSAARPELFSGVPWSTGAVLERTREIAAASGLKAAFLPTLYDIDTPADSRRLWRDLRRGVVDAPETFRALANLTLFERGTEPPSQSNKEKS